MQKINNLHEYQLEYKKSTEHPEDFWAEKADSFHWKRRWDKIINWDFEKPRVKWFEGAQLNITENCLDRHLESLGDKTAILWEPNNPEEEAKHISYTELHQQVSQFSNVLKSLGVVKGDRIALYMPMVPELAIAVLACARIGAIHSVVFAGFSAKALADRINDSSCKLLLTADGSYRGLKTLDLKSIVDTALESCPSIEHAIVLERTGAKPKMMPNRDLWWHELIAGVSSECEARTMDAEDELFILYTSGSTGKPKGVVHTSAGYMVYAEYSFRNVFQYEGNDVFWCTADIGWIRVIPM